MFLAIGVAAVFAVILAMSLPQTESEHYTVYLQELHDAYLVGEPYWFTYTFMGYGSPCADHTVYYPNHKGDTTQRGISMDCNTDYKPENFVEEYPISNEDVKPFAIDVLGTYNVIVEFDIYDLLTKETVSDEKRFHVVEKICDDTDAGIAAQCISDSFDSCTSAYLQHFFTTVEGDPIFVDVIVESWNDCNLRVYMDTTHDTYGGQSSGILNSVCQEIETADQYWHIHDCDNFDLPPIVYDQQRNIREKTCEAFDGRWNPEFATCFDYSNDYDCIGKRGELVSVANPTASDLEFSSNHACKFKK